MVFDTEPVPLSEIDSENRTFRITTDREDGPLKKSIGEIGLIVPPILRRNGPQFLIISGFRRVAVCRNLAWRTIDARILAPETSPLRSAQIAIAENAFQRELNPIELSRAYRLLNDHMTDGGIGRAALALNLPGTPALIEKLLLLAGFPDAIQRGILSGALPLPIALELAESGDAAGSRLADIFNELRPSLNKQREILGLAGEIAARDDLTLSEFFQSAEVLEILSDEKSDRNQKIHRLRIYLKRMRFPNLSLAEERFQGALKTLKLEPGVQLMPPSFFEGSTFNLSVRFSRRSELETAKDIIDRILQSPDIQHFII